MNFDQQIRDFEKTGEFVYKFDEVGNIILSTSSSIFQQNYLSIPLNNVNYNYNKMNSFYDYDFTEFVRPSSDQLTEQEQNKFSNDIAFLTEKNKTLQSQLNRLIAETELNSSTADEKAIEDIILGLRILLGQGKSSKDFRSEFPYLPIPLENRDNI